MRQNRPVPWSSKAKSWPDLPDAGTEQTDCPVIVGGGIAGLTLAITLARQGKASVVLEAQPAPSEAGAGIQLGPNATRILRDLGLLKHLQVSAVAPQSIAVGDARTGRAIVELPLGDWMEKRYGAPYLVVHRADLQKVLLKQAGAEAGIDLRFGRRVSHVALDAQRNGSAGGTENATVAFEDGGSLSGPLFVGADGIWSTLRRALHASPAELKYSGMTASRTTLKMDELPARFQRNVTHVWLAAKAHIVMYPIRGGADVALIVVTKSPEPDQGWGASVARQVFLDGLTAIHRDIQTVLHAAGDWKRWALFDPAPLKTWSNGCGILIGDAAHPILPFLAQGGAMAIEDGYVLGRLIGRDGADPQRVFPAFKAQRMQRVGQVQSASRSNGRIYHVSGLQAMGRDLAMRTVPPGFLMQRYDWIYNWRYHEQET